MKKKPLKPRMLFESSSLSFSRGRFVFEVPSNLTLRILSSDSPALLRIEIVNEEEWDTFFYYISDITPDSFAHLKEEQTLRVDFTNFSFQLVSLLEKCTTFSTGFRVSINPCTDSSKQDECLLLSINELTTFRELSHVCLKVHQASEMEARKYLMQRLHNVIGEVNRLEPFQFELSASKTALEESQLSLENLRKEMKEVEASKISLQGSLVSSEKQVLSLELQIANHKETENQLSTKHDQALQSWSQERNQLVSQVATLEKTVRECQTLIDSKKVELSEKEQSIREEQRLAEELRIQLSETKEQLHTAGEKQNPEFAREVESLNKRISQKNKVIQAQETRVVFLEGQVAEFQTKTFQATQALEAERSARVACEQTLDTLKRTLEHNQQILEENQRLITYLQQKSF